MDQQGEQSMIQANCSISGTPISFPDAGSVEVVQTSDGNFRLVQQSNGQHFGFQEQQTVIQQQYQQAVFKEQNVIYESQISHQIQQQQMGIEGASYYIMPGITMQQQLQQNTAGVQRIVLANSSTQEKVNQIPQLIKLQGGRIVMVNTNPHVIPISNIQNVQDVQQKQGLHLPAASPPKSGRSRGKIITLDGIVTSSSHKPEGQTSPQKIQIAPQIANVQIAPSKVQMHQISPQPSPSGQMHCSRQLQQLNPVQILASPQIMNVNGTTVMQSPSPHRTVVTPKSSLGASKPSGQVITTGNKFFNIISSTTCKAVPLGATSDENEISSSEPEPRTNVESFSLQHKLLTTPQLPLGLGRQQMRTPPPQTAVSLPTTPVAPKEVPKKEDDVTPIYKPGKYALCKGCGYSSLDFNRCQRCKRKLPDDAKTHDVHGGKVGNSPKMKITTPPKMPPTTSKLVSAVPSSSTPKLKPVDQKPNLRLNPLILKPKKTVVTMANRRPKRNEEPVCLTISDDEDEQANKDKEAPTPMAVASPAEPTRVVKEMCPLLKAKEPSLSEIQQPEEVTDLILGLPNAMLENYRKGLAGLNAANIKCRTVRVGSYKVEPLDSVLFCPEGVRICLPHPETKVAVVLEIPRCNLSGVLSHLGRSMPVFFLYLKSATCERIRQLLGMKDASKEPYFDSESNKETQKRITLLPERVSDESKLIIKRIFSKEYGKDVMTSIEAKDANIILVRASPINPDSGLTPKQLRSQDATKVPKDVIKELIVYPKPPLKGGIPITTDDYICLGEEQFLNDVIIDFYLKYLVNKLTEDDQSRTHVFSSFFYRRLTTKQIARKSENPAQKLTPAEQRHARVKSWTKNVDIFEKDFIFIPINEHAHWFLAVICFPGLEGLVRLADGTAITAECLRQQKQATVKRQDDQSVKQFTIGATTVTVSQSISPQTVSLLKDKAAKTQVISLDEDEGSERDEAEGDEEEFKDSGDENEPELQDPEKPPEVEEPIISQPEAPTYHPNAIKQPCILIFDSLPNNRRSRTVATLRDYLKIEYKAKKGAERDFNKDSIRGALPKVPQQNNFTDCGIFMLQYAESFFESPIMDFHLPLKNLNTWFDETTIRGKREGIAKLIQQLMAESNVDIKLPELTFPKPLQPQPMEVGVTAEPLPPLPPNEEAAPPPPPPPPPPEEQLMEAPLVAMQAESVGTEMVSLSVVVPEDHVLPPAQAHDSEIVVSEEPSRPVEAKSLNESTDSSVDPDNLSSAERLLDALFPNDDGAFVLGSGEPAHISPLKRSADSTGDEISAKRVC